MSHFPIYLRNSLHKQHSAFPFWVPCWTIVFREAIWGFPNASPDCSVMMLYSYATKWGKQNKNIHTHSICGGFFFGKDPLVRDIRLYCIQNRIIHSRVRLVNSTPSLTTYQRVTLGNFKTRCLSFPSYKMKVVVSTLHFL